MKPPLAANDNLIERTRRLWMLRFGRDLSHEEAREAVENVTGFFAILDEWSRVERRAANRTKDAGGREHAEVRHES
jgi:hypothetical protein